MPGLRPRPRHRLRLRAGAALGSPRSRPPSGPLNIWRFEELLPIVDARGPGPGRPVLRPDAADPRRPPRRRARPAQPLPQGRLDQPAHPLLQGPGGRDGDRPPARAGQGRDRLRLDRQRRHRRRLARRQGRRRRLHLLPRQPGARQGARPAARSAPRSASSTATTTRPTAPAASSRWPAASSSPTSPCARSTPRGRRRWPSRSSSSSSWRSPDHFVIPAAGGTLSSRVHKGLDELEMVGLAETAADQDQRRPGRAAAPRSRPRSSRAAARSSRRCPRRAAHSLAIGAPGDGPLVARRRAQPRRLGGGRVRRARSSTAIDLLGATEGILTEPAGGTTIAATMKLAAARASSAPTTPSSP